MLRMQARPWLQVGVIAGSKGRDGIWPDSKDYVWMITFLQAEFTDILLVLSSINGARGSLLFQYVPAVSRHTCVRLDPAYSKLSITLFQPRFPFHCYLRSFHTKPSGMEVVALKASSSDQPFRLDILTVSLFFSLLGLFSQILLS